MPVLDVKISGRKDTSAPTQMLRHFRESIPSGWKIDYVKENNFPNPDGHHVSEFVLKLYGDFPDDAPAPKLREKHNHMAKCGCSVWYPYFERCPRCGLEAEPPLCVRNPYAIGMDNHPMLASALIIRSKAVASFSFLLPASEFVGDSATLTEDTLQAIDHDLASFYTRCGIGAWMEFCRLGATNELRQRVQHLMSGWSVGLVRASEILANWERWYGRA